MTQIDGGLTEIAAFRMTIRHSGLGPALQPPTCRLCAGLEEEDWDGRLVARQNEKIRGIRNPLRAADDRPPRGGPDGMLV